MKSLCYLLGLAVSLGFGSLALAEDTALTTPGGFAMDSAGNFVVTCQGKKPSVVVLSRQGKKLLEFTSERLEQPGGLAVGAAGRIIVANTRKDEKDEIVLFDSHGKFVSAAGGLSKPTRLAVGPKGLIYVCDTGHSRIAVFDEDAKKMLFVIDKVSTGDSGTVLLKSPMGVRVADGKLYICDTGNGRVVSMDAPTGPGQEPKPTIHKALYAAPESVAISKGGRMLVLDRGAIRDYALEGKKGGVFSGQGCSGFSPVDVVVDADQNVLVADRSTARIVVTNLDFFEVVPEVKLDKGDPTTATISWATLRPTPTVVRYGRTEDCDQQYKDDKPTTRHVAVLKGLSPSAGYRYHVQAPMEAIPSQAQPMGPMALEIQTKNWKHVMDGYSGEYGFVTWNQPGKTDWVSTPVVVLVYRRVSFGDDPKTGKKIEDRVLDDNDIEVLKQEMETYRMWVWRHTSCKINFNWTYVIVNKARPNGIMGGPTNELVADMAAGCKEQKKDLKNYWYGIVCGTAGWYACYLAGPVGDPPYELGTCYTSFGHGTKHGWWWFPTHEHGHLMHSWIMCSGVGFFCFPDAPWSMPGKFGEDFSFLAYNYRQIPVRNWLLLRKGVICQSADYDGSGVPDDDPRVPIDKKRFGWTKDMKGSCLKHLMAGVRTPGSLANSFTDFEGKTHKLNEGELYWVDRKAPKYTPPMNGTLDETKWKEFSSVPALYTPESARELHAKLYVAWDEKNFYFTIKSNKKVAAMFHLDANNDGWFHGRDNLWFNVYPASETAKAQAGGQIWDFLNNTMNLHNNELWYRDAYKPGDIIAASGQQGSGYVLQVAIPARPDCKIQPKKGEKFAVRLNLSPAAGEDFPGVSFWDGEDFVYDIECVGP